MPDSTAVPPSVLLDVDVVLDVLARRKPFFSDSAAVLAALGGLPALAPVEFLPLLPAP